MAEMNALVTIETLTPAIVFAPGGVESIVSKLEAEVRAIKTDMSTEKGRKEIASLAYKVARSKTALDEMGKDLVAEIKTQAGKIDAERRIIRDRLEALKDEVRKPLTDWENAEKDRIAEHEAAITFIENMGRFEFTPTAADIKVRIDMLANREPRQWQEFVQRASEVSLRVGKALEDAHETALKREAEAAELERFRAEQAARAQKEREERIAAEAAEAARLEAENKAAREADKAAQAAEIERLAVLKEMAAAKAKAEKAERDAKAAIESERKRVADEKAREAAETARREADKKHRAKVNNEILAALRGLSSLHSLGLTDDACKGIISAIVRGEVPYIKIAY